MNSNLVSTRNYDGPINVGDYVRVAVGRNMKPTEHIWLSVSDVDVIRFNGMVESRPTALTMVTVGDVITFARRHVIQRMTHKQMQMGAGVLLNRREASHG